MESGKSAMALSARGSMPGKIRVSNDAHRGCFGVPAALPIELASEVFSPAAKRSPAHLDRTSEESRLREIWAAIDRHTAGPRGFNIRAVAYSSRSLSSGVWIGRDLHARASTRTRQLIPQVRQVDAPRVIVFYHSRSII